MTDTLTPTNERIRHSGDRYLAPAKDQATDRPHGRIRSCWDILETARCGVEPTLEPHQGMAGRTVDLYWRVVNEPRGITGGYGQPRWNGTPVGQLVAGMLGPEWRETCRNRLIQAELSVELETDWDALIAMISRDGTAGDVGRALGYRSRRWQMKMGAESLRRSLDQLARHFGYTRL